MQRIHLLLDSARGIYIPRDFTEFEGWNGISGSDREDLKSPENEYYWDTWDKVIQSARYTDKEGKVWHLYQDGDLYAFRADLLADDESEEYRQFFGDY